MAGRPKGTVVTAGKMLEMPRGEMTASDAGAMGEILGQEMPRGEMTASEAGAMGEMLGREMPRGEMTASEAGAMGESLGAVELPGLWRMTISPVSR